MTYSSSLANNFQQLKTLFTGQQALIEIDKLPEKELMRPKNYTYFNRWQVVWIIATSPFLLISHIFLKTLAFLVHSNWLYLQSKLLIRNINYLSIQLNFGSALWVPSDNEYQPHLYDIYDLPPVKRTAISDPLIKSKLHRDLKRVNHNRVGKGLCFGGCNWFNFLVLKKLQNSKRPIEQILVAIAKQFEWGQPKQAALIQSYFGLELDLLDLSIATIDQFEGQNIPKQLQLLADGVYILRSQEHCSSYIKWEGKEFIWDSREGLISITHPRIAREIIDDTIGGSPDKSILCIQLTNP